MEYMTGIRESDSIALSIMKMKQIPTIDLKGA